MKQKTVLLYCFGTDEVLLGSPKVAGIQVQMSFWAQTFVHHGWKVYSFSTHKSGSIEGIDYIYCKTPWLSRHGMSIISEFIDSFKYIRKTKADLVLIRGGQRTLYAVNMACKRFNANMVFLSASDRDFEPGKELFKGKRINVKIGLCLYRKALHDLTYFVTQNQFQLDNLLKHYGKHSIIIPNIWGVPEANIMISKKYSAIWVANLRRLKRAEWFINLAMKLPQHKFAIVGGVNEQDYYNAMKEKANAVANLEFLGPQPLNAVNELLNQSKVLVCTSEFEGFPNTFLQAWAYNVPIVSTVNPSNFISDCGLGAVVENEEQLLQSVVELLNSRDEYERCQNNIKRYFTSHHDAEMAYQKVMKLVNEK